MGLALSANCVPQNTGMTTGAEMHDQPCRTYLEFDPSYCNRHEFLSDVSRGRRRKLKHFLSTPQIVNSNTLLST